MGLRSVTAQMFSEGVWRHPSYDLPYSHRLSTRTTGICPDTVGPLVANRPATLLQLHSTAEDTEQRNRPVQGMGMEEAETDSKQQNPFFEIKQE